MMCPYLQGKEEVIEQIIKQFDDGGNNTFLEDKRVSKQIMFECKQKDCAAWRKEDGDTKSRCHYNG